MANEEKMKDTTIKSYRLNGKPVLKLFNHVWEPNIKEPNHLVTGRYDRYAFYSDFFRRTSGNNLHLVKIRSRSHGKYGPATYGSDNDVIFCEGSFVNLGYSSVNPDFDIPEEKATCSIDIFSNKSSKIERTRKMLENICGEELIRKINRN